jgi:hypothetical protein
VHGLGVIDALHEVTDFVYTFPDIYRCGSVCT